MASADNSWDIETWGALFLIGILVLAGLGYWYVSHREMVNTPLIAWARLNALLFSRLPTRFPGPLAPIGIDAADCRVVLHFIATHAPADMTWKQVRLCVELASAPWRFFAWIVFLPMGVYAYFGSGRLTRCRRKYTMRQLMVVMSERFPSLTTATRFDFLAPESYTSGPWRVSMSPIEWAWRHGVWYQSVPHKRRPPREWVFRKDPPGNLIYNERSPVLRDPKIRASLRFDAAKANALFVKQLGGPFTGWKGLPWYAQGLAAAFVAFGSGPEGRKAGQAFLDQMSRSVHQDQQGRIVVDVTGAEDLWTHYVKKSEGHEALEPHKSFWRVWMVGALDYARSRGTLSSSQFIWLRGVDRTLWYALNQAGGRRPWVEAIGIYAHHDAESEIEQVILEPEMLDAADWLRSDLVEAGWLDEEPGETHDAWSETGSRSPAGGAVSRKTEKASASLENDIPDFLSGMTVMGVPKPKDRHGAE